MSKAEYIDIRWRPTTAGIGTGSFKVKRISAHEKEFSIPSVERGQGYEVEARSVTIHGVASAWVSVPVTVDGTAIPPPAPISLGAESVADGVHLTWALNQALPFNMEFEVQRASDSGFTTDVVTINKVRALSYQDGVTDGVVRWYRVRSIDYAGTASAWSDPIDSRGKTVEDGADVSANATPTPVLNMEFEAGDKNWTRGTGWAILSGGTGMRGDWFAQHTGTVDSELLNDGRMSVDGVTSVKALTYVRAWSTNGSIKVGVRWFDNAGLVIQTDWSPLLAAASAPTYKAVQLVAISPANAVTAAIVIATSGQTTGSWTVDNANLGSTWHRTVDDIPDGPTRRIPHKDYTDTIGGIIGIKRGGSFRPATDIFTRNLDLLQGSDFGLASVPVAALPGTQQLPFNVTFDEWDDGADWIGGASYVATAGQGVFGGSVLEAPDSGSLYWAYKIPHDPYKLYKFTCTFRATVDDSNGSLVVYFGFQGFRADGSPVGVTGLSGTGSFHEQSDGAGGTGTQVAVADGWVKVTAYWKGRGIPGTLGAVDPAQAPGVAYQDVRYMSPSIRWSSDAGDGVVEVDHFSIEEVGFQVGGDTLAELGVPTSKLLSPHSDNLIPNWNSEQGTSATGKDPEGNGLVNDPTNSYNGNWCRKMVLPAAGVSTSINFSPAIPCKEQDGFWFEARVKSSSNLVGGCNLFIEWLDKDKAAINWAIKNVLPTTSYQRFSISGKAPTGAVYCRFRIDNNGVNGQNGSDTGKSVYVDVMEARKMVHFDMLDADTIKTSNYLEYGDAGAPPVDDDHPAGTPYSGSKMDNQGTSLKVAPDNFQVGVYTLTDSFFRAANTIDGDTNTLYAWRGNIDTSVRGGRPYVGTDDTGFGTGLNVYLEQYTTNSSLSYCKVTVVLRPSSDPADNLEAITYVKLIPVKVNHNGGSFTPSDIGNLYVPINDRGIAASEKRPFASAYHLFPYGIDFVTGQLLTGIVWWRGSILNTYGWSDEIYFQPTASAGYYPRTTTPPTGAPPPDTGSGGGSLGGTCPEFNEPIMLADGTEIRAIHLKPGHVVITQDSRTLGWGRYVVQGALPFKVEEMIRVTLKDGRVLLDSKGHRFYAQGLGWLANTELKEGMRLEGGQVGIVHRVDPVGPGSVMKISVDGAQTFLQRAILSHNAKRL